MSNCFWSNAVAFVVGAAVGAVATLKYVEYKQKRMEEEEIENAKAAGIPIEEEDVVTFDKEVETTRDGMRLYHKIATEYRGEEAAPVEKKEEVKTETEEVEENMNVSRPYVISPEEFGELDGYRQESLQYFADGYLADDMNNLVDPLEGINPEAHFGEYEADSVFVRDDRRKVDYEILRDLRNYVDVCMPKRRRR